MPKDSLLIKFLRFSLIVLAIGLGGILYSFTFKDLDLTIKLISGIFTLGSFCFIAGSFLYKENLEIRLGIIANFKSKGREFFRLSFYFFLTATTFLISFLGSNHSESTCLGLEINFLAENCGTIISLISLIGLAGSIIFFYTLFELIEYVYKLKEL
jgi:hypothetical protein